MEIYQDARVYDTPMITVVEIMGRNAGWLTASAALATYKGSGPDLIYLPEVPFTMDKFLSDVRKVYDKSGKVIVAFSEGCKDENGTYIAEMGAELAKDAFGHAQLGGAAAVLANKAKDEFGCKVRGIEFSLMQRCGAHLGSKTDVDEAFNAGQKAVKAAVSGLTDHMVAFERVMVDGKYTCELKLVNLSISANTEKTVPDSWINDEGNFVTDEFINYALPLIQGDSHPPYVDGLPLFAKLKKVQAGKNA